MSDSTVDVLYDLAHHVVLAVALAQILLLQVVILDVVAPSRLAEHAEVTMIVALMLLVYGLFPAVRVVIEKVAHRIERRYAGGETA